MKEKSEWNYWTKKDGWELNLRRETTTAVCLTLKPAILSLSAPSNFACSVASLSRCSLHYQPGRLRLRRTALAEHTLEWGLTIDVLKHTRGRTPKSFSNQPPLGWENGATHSSWQWCESNYTVFKITTNKTCFTAFEQIFFFQINKKRVIYTTFHCTHKEYTVFIQFFIS